MTSFQMTIKKKTEVDNDPNRYIILSQDQAKVNNFGHEGDEYYPGPLSSYIPQPLFL